MEFVELEWDDSRYIIYIELVESIKGCSANGKYIPEEKKIQIVKPTSKTIYHESIHAVLDMFKTTKENFNNFYDNCVFFEESFCHYVCDLATAIEAIML